MTTVSEFANPFPRGRNLILTAADTAGTPMLDVTADLMLAYALRIGADFKVLRAENHPGFVLPRPHAVKLYTGLELVRYDRVTWIDADCLVSPRAPSIFDAVPAMYRFAAWCDEGKAFAALRKRPVYRHGYFNSGVMLSAAAEPFALALEFLADKERHLTAEERAIIMGEQTPMNKAVHELGMEVFPLGPEWNFLLNRDQCRLVGVDLDVRRAHIVHSAGGAHLRIADPKDRTQRAAAMRKLRDSLGW
jgi:hypothetical protein